MSEYAGYRHVPGKISYFPREEATELEASPVDVSEGELVRPGWGGSGFCSPVTVFLYGLSLLILLFLLWLCFRNYHDQISKKQQENDQKLMQLMQAQRNAYGQPIGPGPGAPLAGDGNMNGNGVPNNFGPLTCPQQQQQQPCEANGSCPLGRRPNGPWNQQGPIASPNGPCPNKAKVLLPATNNLNQIQINSSPCQKLKPAVLTSPIAQAVKQYS
jgi:hypothetical protein